MTEELKSFPFELKELSDGGDFVGFASVYGNKDLGNDIVEPGAFDKSISEFGPKVRLMDSHKIHIGVAFIESTPFGLKATGKINTKKVSGQESLSDLKFYRDNEMPMGMSMGYQTIKSDRPYATPENPRRLKELRVWEVTLTAFPMNELATVTDVKAGRVISAANRDLIQRVITDLQALLNMADSDKSLPITETLTATPTGDGKSETTTDLSAFNALVSQIRDILK